MLFYVTAFPQMTGKKSLLIHTEGPWKDTSVLPLVVVVLRIAGYDEAQIICQHYKLAW